MMTSMMWVEKYRPKTFAEVIGNEEAKIKFESWLNKKKKRKAALLYGPAGVGKTSLVYAVANEKNYNVVEMNASDIRTKKAVLQALGPAATLVSLDTFSSDKRSNILLLDEVDGVYGQQDRGGVQSITEIIKTSKIPLVLTANDVDSKKLRPIRRLCQLIRFRRIRYPLIVALLGRICKLERINAKKEALEFIAIRSQGDLRSAINDLQRSAEDLADLKLDALKNLPRRDRTLGIHETIREMILAHSFEEALKVLNNSLLDFDTLLLSVNDNLIHRYSNPQELAEAYDALSKVDIIRGRIGVKNWHFLRYFYRSLAHVLSFNSKKPRMFTPIFPPIKRTILSWTRSDKMLLDTISAKIGTKCHISRRKAKLEMLPYLRLISKKGSEDANRIKSWLMLDDKAMDYLLEVN